MSTLSIVVPVFNKFSLTDRCLRSMLSNSANKHQVTIIDNNSSDETAKNLPAIRQLFIDAGWKFDIQTNSKNVGFGRAMNQGARASTGDYLALINNDTLLLPNWDSNLISTLERNPEWDLIFPYIDETQPFDESRILQAGEAFQKRNKHRSRKAFTGVLMFFRKSAFDKLEGFDERFFVTYEDTDVRVRMDELNMQYRMVGSCVIWHQSMSTRGDTKLLPSGFELEGKKLFFEKWGFHFSEREKTTKARWARRLTRWRNRLGIL